MTPSKTHGIKKLVGDMEADPSKFFKRPEDVLRDRRLNNEQRSGILKSWHQDALGNDAVLAQQIARMRTEFDGGESSPFEHVGRALHDAG